MKKVVLFLVFVSLAFVWADTIDYGRQVIVVTVLQSEDVTQQRSEDLTSRALQVLKSARYDRDLTVASFLAAHSKQERRLGRMTLESRRGDTKYRSDGVVSVDYEFPITGNILEQLVPETGGDRLLGKVACPCCGQPWPEDKEVPPGVELVPYEDESTPVYTGILVDARGLQLSPALFPRLVTEQDDEVYGPGFAKEEELAEQGMVGYYRNQTEALMSERVGSDPLIVRALSVAGTNYCDLVVSGRNAAGIHGSRANLELLARCRVGLLVD